MCYSTISIVTLGLTVPFSRLLYPYWPLNFQCYDMGKLTHSYCCSKTNNSSKQAKQPNNKQANNNSGSKRASKQANKQASKRASKQASKQTRTRRQTRTQRNGTNKQINRTKKASQSVSWQKTWTSTFPTSNHHLCRIYIYIYDLFCTYDMYVRIRIYDTYIHKHICIYIYNIYIIHVKQQVYRNSTRHLLVFSNSQKRRYYTSHLQASSRCHRLPDSLYQCLASQGGFLGWVPQHAKQKHSGWNMMSWWWVDSYCWWQPEIR